MALTLSLCTLNMQPQITAATTCNVLKQSKIQFALQHINKYRTLTIYIKPQSSFTRWVFFFFTLHSFFSTISNISPHDRSIMLHVKPLRFRFVGFFFFTYFFQVTKSYLNRHGAILFSMAPCPALPEIIVPRHENKASVTVCLCETVNENSNTQWSQEHQVRVRIRVRQQRKRLNLYSTEECAINIATGVSFFFFLGEFFKLASAAATPAKNQQHRKAPRFD